MTKTIAQALALATLLGAIALPAFAADPSPEADKALWCKTAFETVSEEFGKQDKKEQADQMAQLAAGMEQIAVGHLTDEGFSPLEIAGLLNAAMEIDRELLPGGSKTRFTSDDCLALLPAEPAKQ
jgi:hypothetical protein